MGPLTQAILLINEDKYHSKFSRALLNSISMLPMGAEIINCLKDARSPGQVMGILKELGDILLLTTGRSTQKIYMPLLMILSLWRNRRDSPNLQWSFSGAAMMKFYNLPIKNGLHFKIKTGGDALKTQEVLFPRYFWYIPRRSECAFRSNYSQR